MITITLASASANKTAQSYALGCATVLQFKNLMNDKQKVFNECKECITNVPMYKIDKTEQLINSLIPVCTNKYFNERNKK